MNNDHETRRDAIVNSACEQIRGLLETHFRDITKAAEESFVGDEAKSDPLAKVSCVIEFGALAQATTVSAKIGWSVKYSDESEEEIDPLQSKLGLPEVNPKVRELAGRIEKAGPSKKAAVMNLINTMRDANVSIAQTATTP